MYDHLPPNPVYHRDFVTHQYVDEQQERVLFPEIVGYQLFGDIFSAVMQINTEYKADGIVIYDISPDQMVEPDEVSFSARGLVRAVAIDMLTNRPTGDKPLLKEDLAKKIDRVTARRVYESSMKLRISQLSDEVFLSMEAAANARLATLAALRTSQDGSTN